MKKILIFASPLIILLEFILYNFIANLMTQPNDTAVFVGITLICVSMYLNYLLFIFIKKTFKK